MIQRSNTRSASAMKHVTIALAIVCSLCAIAIASCGNKYPDGSALLVPEDRGHGSLLINEGEPMAYYLHLPEGYSSDASKDERYPLLVSLHGMGQAAPKISGGLFQTTCVPALARAAGAIGVEESARSAVLSGMRPALKSGLLLAPQNKTTNGWAIQDLEAIIARVLAAYRVDAGRVYMTGVSMGGIGAWDYAAAYPDRLAALLPVCGRHERAGTAEKLGGTAVWVFHAIDDPAVVFTGAYMGVLDMLTPDPDDDLKAWLGPEKPSTHLTATGTERYDGWKSGLLPPAGTRVVTLYSNGGHNIWNTAYSTAALWDWVYAQKRP